MAWCRQALRLLTGLYDTTFSLVHNELKSGNRITQNTDKFKLYNFWQHIFLKEKLALLLYLLPHNRRGNDFSNQYSFLGEQDKVTPGSAAHPELALDLVIPGRVLVQVDHIVLFLEVVSFLQGCLLSFKVSVFVRTVDFKKSRSTLRAMYQTIRWGCQERPVRIHMQAGLVNPDARVLLLVAKQVKLTHQVFIIMAKRHGRCGDVRSIDNLFHQSPIWLPARESCNSIHAGCSDASFTLACPVRWSLLELLTGQEKLWCKTPRQALDKGLPGASCFRVLVCQILQTSPGVWNRGWRGIPNSRWRWLEDSPH